MLGFYPSSAKSVPISAITCKDGAILEITCKEIVYIGYQPWGEEEKIKIKFIGWEIGMNGSISDEITIYFGNSQKKCIFY